MWESEAVLLKRRQHKFTSYSLCKKGQHEFVNFKLGNLHQWFILFFHVGSITYCRFLKSPLKLFMCPFFETNTELCVCYKYFFRAHSSQIWGSHPLLIRTDTNPSRNVQFRVCIYKQIFRDFGSWIMEPVLDRFQVSLLT